MASPVVTQFKLETTQYESKLRDATQSLRDMLRVVNTANGDFNSLSDQQRKAAASFGSIATGAKDAKGKVRELVTAYNDVARQYNIMSKKMQESDTGRAIAGQMEDLKKRISEAKKEMVEMAQASNQVQKSQVNMEGILGEVGSQLGINSNLLSMLTTGSMGYVAAAGAVTAAVVAATKAWADYNSELVKQNQITSVTLGIDPQNIEAVTVNVRALSDTFGVDFRETINAMNTLMTQFGVTSDEAFGLVADGLQGMIQGDGPKLLSMIQQYVPSFRDAGISASQLVAIIHNSEGGIFTDQNMNAIVMGIRNIRLMTTSTSEALKGLGINGEEMSKKLNDGSMSIFEALKQVSHAIQQAGGSSQEAGVVMQQVFGRQGTMAGTNLGKAIETLNTNLEETKTQTGEVGQRMRDLVDTSMRLEQAKERLFATDDFDRLSKETEEYANVTLAGLLEVLRESKEGWEMLYDIANDFADTHMKGDGWVIVLDSIKEAALKTVFPLADVVRYLHELGASGTDTSGNPLGGNVRHVGHTGNEQVMAPVRPIRSATRPTGGARTSAGRISSTPDPVAGSIDYQTKKVQELQKAWRAAADDDSRQRIKAQIDEAQHALDIMTGKVVELPVKTITAQEAVGKAASVQDKGFLDITPTKIITPIQAYEAELARLKELQAEAWWTPEQFQAYSTAIDEVQGKIDALKGIKDVGKDWKNAAQAISQVGSALSSIQDPAAKVLGIIAQAIASVALGFAQATSKEAPGGVWKWIAAVAAGLGTMISTISAIHSATGYAQGGIVDGRGGGFVPGTQYSGDNVGNVRLDAGELVLNRAMQSSLASQLQDNADNTQHIVGVLHGTDIWLSVNRTTKRQGLGEIVTW